VARRAVVLNTAMPPRYLLPLLLLGLWLLLPGTAAASSIAFIKDNNVWLVSPDGARQRQVTTDGTAAKSYDSPSQADDGTILAKHGSHFVRLRPDGTRIGQPVPGLGSDYSHSGNVFVMSGPNDPRISPDGKRLTYWISARAMVTCPIWAPGCSYNDTDYTIVSHVDRFTQPEEFGAVRDYRDPSWVDDGNLLVFNYGLGVKAGAISPVGAGEGGLLQWFDAPGGVHQIGQGQVTRQGDKLVTLAGSADFGPAQEHLWFYGVASYPAEPLSACYIRDAAAPSGKFLVPSWSPDGTEVAVTESDGIHIYGNIPDLRVADPNCGAITDRVLVYGAKPAWGPADVPTGGGPPTPPAPGPGPVGPAKPASPLGDVSAKRRQRGRAVRVRVNVLTAGADVRVKLVGARRKPLGAAVKRGAPAGRPTMNVRLNRRGRAALRRAGRLRLTARVAVTAAGAAPATAARKVTLRR
jgi:WD40-like Beta Propeller Repeat